MKKRANEQPAEMTSRKNPDMELIETFIPKLDARELHFVAMICLKLATHPNAQAKQPSEAR